MKSLEPYKNQSLAECYYVSPDGKKIIRNYTCHEVQANLKGEKVMSNFFKHRVYKA